MAEPSANREPLMSLTQWGEPISPALDQLFAEAQDLQAAGRPEAALAKYQELLEASARGPGLFAPQYLHILLRFGHCYSELQDYRRALAVYEVQAAALAGNYREASSSPWWPEGFQVVVLNPVPSWMVAQNAFEAAVALAHLAAWPQAADQFIRSFEGYRDTLPAEAWRPYRAYAGLARHYRRWDHFLAARRLFEASGLPLPTDLAVPEELQPLKQKGPRRFAYNLTHREPRRMDPTQEAAFVDSYTEAQAFVVRLMTKLRLEAGLDDEAFGAELLASCRSGGPTPLFARAGALVDTLPKVSTYRLELRADLAENGVTMDADRYGALVMGAVFQELSVEQAAD